MKMTLQLTMAILSLVLPLTASGQSLVDFRQTVRSARPALATVTVSNQVALASNKEAKADSPDGDREYQPDGRRGPRLQLFDQDGNAVAGGRWRQRRMAAAHSSDTIGAGFAVDQDLLIAFVGNASGEVTVETTSDEQLRGSVVAKDHVTGLAAIRVQQSGLESLVVGSTDTEPGTPVVATWLANGKLNLSTGTVSSDAIATGSGIGLAPRISFAESGQLAGTPVLDSQSLVVGVLVPSSNGGLVPVHSASIKRLIQAATSSDPQNLRRAMLGVQFQGDGALVMDVSADSAAEKAGIEAGDLIKQIDDLPISSASDVIAVIAGLRSGDTADVTVQRGDETHSLSVTLGEHPNQQIAGTQGSRRAFAMQQAYELKDGKLQPIDPQFNYPRNFNGFPMEDFFKHFPPLGRSGPLVTPRPPHIPGQNMGPVKTSPAKTGPVRSDRVKIGDHSIRSKGSKLNDPKSRKHWRKCSSN